MAKARKEEEKNKDLQITWKAIQRLKKCITTTNRVILKRWRVMVNSDII